MANVEQFQNEAPLVTQRTGILATSSNAVARIREAIDQPGFRRAFPTLLASLTAVAAIVLYWGLQKPEHSLALQRSLQCQHLERAFPGGNQWQCARRMKISSTEAHTGND